MTINDIAEEIEAKLVETHSIIDAIELLSMNDVSDKEIDAGFRYWMEHMQEET